MKKIEQLIPISSGLKHLITQAPLHPIGRAALHGFEAQLRKQPVVDVVSHRWPDECITLQRPPHTAKVSAYL